MADQPDASLQPILTKLAAARTRLIMERPFLGALVMHLPLKVGGDWCTTTGTDAQAFYFNPKFVDNLTLAQTQFILAHEAMHCAMGHPHRRNHRVKRRWDVACDHAVNLILIEEGLKPPLHGILADQNFITLSAEEIYPLIPEDTPEESFDQHLFDNDNESGASPDENQRQDNPDAGESGGQGKEGQSEAEEKEGSGSQASQKPNELSPSEREELAEQWKNRLAAAAQAARQAGKLSQSMLRWVDGLLAPSLPWRALLARFFAVNQRDDYSWRRPSRREGDALLPRLSSEGLEVIAAIDTSGSISDDELREFVSELDALKGQVQIGWSLRADCWGHGYAREAAEAMLRLAFGQFGLATVFGQTSESNAASWGLMKRLGMTRLAELDYFDPDYPPEDNPTMIWSLERTAWESTTAQADAHA